MLKKLTLVAFAILALATFSACSDDGDNAGDEVVKGPDNIVIDDGACGGVACDDTPEPSAPECAVDADCGSGKLCNSGKCEEIGGGSGGGGGDGGSTGGGDSGDGSGDGGSSGGNTGGGSGGGGGGGTDGNNGGGNVGGSSGGGDSGGTGGDSEYYSRGRDGGDGDSVESGNGGRSSGGNTGGRGRDGSGGDTGGDDGYYSRGRDGGDAGGNGGSGGGGGGLVNIKNHVTLSDSIASLAGSGNFCPAGCPAGQECKSNKCVDIPSPGGVGQGDSSVKQCMAECKSGSTCINGTCTSLLNISKEKIVVVGGAGLNELPPDTGAEGESSSGGSQEDTSAGAVNVAEGGMCSGNNKCKSGLTCVNEVCTKPEVTNTCNLDFEIVPTNDVKSGDEKTYDYNDSVGVSFFAKGSNGANITWAASRKTREFYTELGKQYAYTWNKDVPIDVTSCSGKEYCTIEVKFRLGNAKNGNEAKTSLEIIDYFKHEIMVTAHRKQDQCEKSAFAKKELKFKFNKPKLEDEKIDGSLLDYHIETENVGVSTILYVEDADHYDLAKKTLDYSSENYTGGNSILKNKNDKTFKDVQFFQLYGDDYNWKIKDDMKYTLHYLILQGKDIYGVVEYGYYGMEVNDNDESWHWEVGKDIYWYMRCSPDVSYNNIEEWDFWGNFNDDWEKGIACGESEGGGNM